MRRELGALGEPIPVLPQTCYVTSDKCLEVSEPRKQTGKGCGSCKVVYSLLVHHQHHFIHAEEACVWLSRGVVLATRTL